jgi:hypothetical protein
MSHPSKIGTTCHEGVMKRLRTEEVRIVIPARGGMVQGIFFLFVVAMMVDLVFEPVRLSLFTYLVAGVSCPLLVFAILWQFFGCELVELSGYTLSIRRRLVVGRWYVDISSASFDVRLIRTLSVKRVARLGRTVAFEYGEKRVRLASNLSDDAELVRDSMDEMCKRASELTYR